MYMTDWRKPVMQRLDHLRDLVVVRVALAQQHPFALQGVAGEAQAPAS